MNLKLSLCLLTLATSVNAGAWTVYDLAGRDAVDRSYWSNADCVIKYDLNLPNPLGLSNHVRFELVVDDFTDEVKEDRIKLCNFKSWLSNDILSTPQDFILYLADDKNNRVKDGTRLILPNDGCASSINYGIAECFSTSKEYFITAGYRNTDEWILDMIGEYNFYFKSTYSDGSPANWVGEISESEDGEIVVDFNDPAAFLSARKWNGNSWASNRAYNSNHIYIIDHYHIETFTPNATFTFREAPYNFISGTNGSYGSFGELKSVPVKFSLNEDGTFNVLNMFDTGYAIYPHDEAGFVHGLVTGHYDAETGNAYLDGGQNGWKDFGAQVYNDSRASVFPGKMTTIKDIEKRKFDVTYADIPMTKANADA